MTGNHTQHTHIRMSSLVLIYNFPEVTCNNHHYFFSLENYLKINVQVFHESVMTKVSSGDVASANYFLNEILRDKNQDPNGKSFGYQKANVNISHAI